MHNKNVITSGPAIEKSGKVLILLHGRGGAAGDILEFAGHLDVKDYTLMAPQATNHAWYPHSFLAPPEQNEPWLSSALNILKEITDELISNKIPAENIYFSGFSQGACLTLEFVARNAKRYGGVAAFTGGLIGDRIYKENYSGDFNSTPVFIGTSDPDSHVPVERVHETTRILQSMNALVTEKIYPGMGHTIHQDEIEIANELIFSKVK